MSNLLIFICIVIFGLIPFGIGVVWFLYKKTIVFPVALTVFFSSMFCAIVSFAVSEYGWNTLYWAIPLCLVALVSANAVFKKLIQRPLKEHKAHIDQLAQEGNLDFQQTAKYTQMNNEIGAMLQSFHSLGINLRKTASFADEIAQSNFKANFTELGSKDKLGISLLNMRQSLTDMQEHENKRKEEEEQRNWITNGIAKFSDILRTQNESIKEISYTLISNLVDYVGANQGGLFVINNDNDDDIYYEMTGAVAYNRQKLLNNKFAIGDGLVGKCAFEKKPVYMEDVPDDYINITSGLGTANPKSVLLMPAKLNDEVFAIIELASFEKFMPYKIEFIEKLGETIASTISSVKTTIQTQRLLEESKQQSEELSAREEEMRQNLEELQATQEELIRLQKEEEKLKLENQE